MDDSTSQGSRIAGPVGAADHGTVTLTITPQQAMEIGTAVMREGAHGPTVGRGT